MIFILNDSLDLCAPDVICNSSLETSFPNMMHGVPHAMLCVQAPITHTTTTLPLPQDCAPGLHQFTFI